MSVYRISSNVNHLISSPHVQSFDLSVHNRGTRSFESLLEVTGPSGIFYMSLCSLAPYSGEGATHVFRDVATWYTPFDLKLVTNIHNTDSVALDLEIKNWGGVVARFSHLEFEVS
ncbi:hypothetical protein [Paenibacillus pinihumi]|uniref:hypothetical protein n=1 Tax=Paenibacillus pinihumi TaxID=669462 RepID=UPI0003FBD3C5|nr:hypothetical protein [Paenibacillus pinihumi]